MAERAIFEAEPRHSTNKQSKGPCHSLCKQKMQMAGGRDAPSLPSLSLWSVFCCLDGARGTGAVVLLVQQTPHPGPARRHSERGKEGGKEAAQLEFNIMLRPWPRHCLQAQNASGTNIFCRFISHLSPRNNAVRSSPRPQLQHSFLQKSS